jgi:predicted DNA binding CopG/RHH family protein
MTACGEPPDGAAEAFLEQDLSGLDFSQFKPVKFEFQAKPDRPRR